MYVRMIKTAQTSTSLRSLQLPQTCVLTTTSLDISYLSYQATTIISRCFLLSSRSRHVSSYSPRLHRLRPLMLQKDNHSQRSHPQAQSASQNTTSRTSTSTTTTSISSIQQNSPTRRNPISLFSTSSLSFVTTTPTAGGHVFSS